MRSCRLFYPPMTSWQENAVIITDPLREVDCFTSHVGEHRTVRGLWKRQGIPCFFKIPTVQQSAETEMPFVYVTLATHVTLATAGYTPCLFVYVTIGLARHNRMHVSQSERLLVKPQRPWTDLCAERVGLWSRLCVKGIHLRQRSVMPLWFFFFHNVGLNKLCTNGRVGGIVGHEAKYIQWDRYIQPRGSSLSDIGLWVWSSSEPHLRPVCLWSSAVVINFGRFGIQRKTRTCSNALGEDRFFYSSVWMLISSDFTKV